MEAPGFERKEKQMDIHETVVGPTEELKLERVQEELRKLPNWQLDAGGKAIESTRDLPSAQASGEFGAWVIGLAGAQGLTVSVSVASGRARVRLSSPVACGGLTQAVFDLARQIG
jgi:hypothetical protein